MRTTRLPGERKYSDGTAMVFSLQSVSPGCFHCWCVLCVFCTKGTRRCRRCNGSRRASRRYCNSRRSSRRSSGRRRWCSVYSGLARLSSCRKAGATPFCALPPLLLPIPLPDTRRCNDIVLHCCATLQCAGYNHHYVGTWHLRLASPLSLRTEAGHSALQIHSR